MAPPDWYADPASPDQLRYWDGAAWTLHTHPIERTPAEPAVAAPADQVAPPPRSVAAGGPVAFVRPSVGGGPNRFDGGRDLATHRAGGAARAQAMAMRRAHPFRSFVARALRRPSDEHAWRVGAEGEERVGRHLRKLGDGWRVLHAIPVGERGDDIDHLVIGPAGVFTINTKHHHSGRVWVAERVLMVNGARTDYAPKAVFEATRAAQLLSVACDNQVAVVPIVAVIARSLTVKAMPKDLWVLEAHRLARWLRQQPRRLSPSDVEMIYIQARWERTWQPNR